MPILHDIYLIYWSTPLRRNAAVLSILIGLGMGAVQLHYPAHSPATPFIWGLGFSVCYLLGRLIEGIGLNID
ncbi:hypothetical protein P280DRAFT_514646 [Massarina eburnea CBS 473.64]|uniref:Uncharacterized protein n=1 Tax=Massarina eburnea CBS 473.64 TaxID=1395130 RepID=A0A6A6S7S0_9PLEO|nr:hypothetical protein P280DRAFT_514646 [Massarina eburnea CBS 473.64]